MAELVEPRFAGNAWRTALLASVLKEDGDIAGAEKLLADAIPSRHASATPL